MSVLGLLRGIASPTHSSGVPRQDRRGQTAYEGPAESSPPQVLAHSRHVSETLRGCELGSLPLLSEKGSILMASAFALVLCFWT